MNQDQPLSGRRANKPQDAFTIERRGEVTVFVASPALESIEFSLASEAANLLLKPIQDQDLPQVVVDLSQVEFFGSVFLAILLRCWKLVSSKGGSMALVGVSKGAMELLRVTSLDMVWPIYETRREAIDALQAD